MLSIKKGERVLITGGTGSLGHELAKHLALADASVRILARDEKKQYDMRKLFPDYEYVLGDIRDYNAVRDGLKDIDTVIHGASLKYVNISEIQPAEYVSTNVDGTMNLMNAVLDNGSIKRLVGISSDKACLPVNAYGLTKALLEKLILEGTRRQGKLGETVFNVARYGNVVGTRGSVVPFWGECKKAGKPLPITNPDMTRFFFTINEAVQLIDKCLESPANVIVSKRMRSCTLGELATVMQGPEGVEIVGERPGEKHHEMLLSSDEMMRTYNDGDYLVYVPAGGILQSEAVEGFSSFNAERISQHEIKELVDEWN